MKYSRILVLCAWSGLFATGAAQAIEYKSVGSDPAVAYDAPGAKGRKVFVAPRGMPVETILTYGDWTKVRDSAVKVANAKVRASADDAGAVAFSADKGVLLELAEPVTSGWVKVKHRDGQSGYVKASEVWGGE